MERKSGNKDLKSKAKIKRLQKQLLVDIYLKEFHREEWIASIQEQMKAYFQMSEESKEGFSCSLA